MASNRGDTCSPDQHTAQLPGEDHGHFHNPAVRRGRPRHHPRRRLHRHALGTLREGSGVVISDEGLVLTIGYLITEAEEVWLTTP